MALLRRTRQDKATWTGDSVDPADGHPLWFRAERLDRLPQLVVCGVHVVIDDGQVEVVLVVAADLTTLLLRSNEVLLLSKHQLLYTQL